MPISDKKDNELSDYQFHCRYCILYGMKMEDAAKLWNEQFKNRHLDRNEYLDSLLLLFRQEDRQYQPQEESSLMKNYIKEGERYISEITRRKRDRALVRHRLEKDEYACQNCGFPASTNTKVPVNSILVEIHHINPIQDGVRETKIDDLISLCPNCHRLIHAIGKEVKSDALPIDLLEKYDP